MLLLWLIFWVFMAYPTLLFGEYLIDAHFGFIPCVLIPTLYSIIGNVGVYYFNND